MVERLRGLSMADLRAYEQTIQEQYALAGNDENFPDLTAEARASREQDLDRYVRLNVLIQREVFSRTTQLLDELDY